MTAAARITEADFKRATAAATRACAASGKPARIIFRLEPREIEIIVGESERDPAPDLNEWCWIKRAGDIAAAVTGFPWL